MVVVVLQGGLGANIFPETCSEMRIFGVFVIESFFTEGACVAFDIGGFSENISVFLGSFLVHERSLFAFPVSAAYGVSKVLVHLLVALV